MPADEQALRDFLDTHVVGYEITIPDGAWKPGTGVLKLRVSMALHGQNKESDGWVWLAGVRLDGPLRGAWIDVQVRLDQLNGPSVFS